MEQYLLATVLLLSVVAVKLRPRRNGKNPLPVPWQLPGSLDHLVGALPHRAIRDLARRRRHGELKMPRLGELLVVVATSPDAAREVTRGPTTPSSRRGHRRPATTLALTREGLVIAFAPHGEHWLWLRKPSCSANIGYIKIIKKLDKI
ncbi:hypothetical protein ABZP36_011176 [Zizania latifolia]